MKRIVTIWSLFVFAGTSQAQLCDFLGRDSLYADISGDTVSIWDMKACAYCSSVFDVASRWSNDSILIVQTDTVFLKTTCDCLFNLRVGISGLSSGTYFAIVYRQKLKKYGYSFDMLESVGTVRFQYLSSSSGTLHFRNFQSSCNPSSVPPSNPIVPLKFVLHQNYPDPFNPGTTIKFELPGVSHVTLTVYDILGREVSVLVNERKEPGVHEVKCDGSNLASGVYFYRLQAGDFTQTKRLLLLK
jgi:hypothetical protein